MPERAGGFFFAFCLPPLKILGIKVLTAGSVLMPKAVRRAA